MQSDTSIFGLRFGANPRLEPGREELEHFLASARTPGDRVSHAADLAPYRELLRSVSMFEREEDPDRSIRDRMFYGVLSHSSFFTPALLSSLELYKYYLHMFYSLDFRKPQVFMAAAQREIAGLDLKKKTEADKAARLQGMIEDRKKALKVLESKREDLIRELENIAFYIRNNLIRITGLCEKAIIFLVQLQTEGTGEQRLIADIKARIKEELKDGLQRGTVTREDLQTAQQNITVFSQEVSKLIREDVFAMSSLYERIQEHAKTTAGRIEDLLKAAAAVKIMGVDEEREAFRELENTLVSLAQVRLTFIMTAEPASKTGYSSLLEQMRNEMLGLYFEHARKERRARKDRRAGKDRRKSHDPNYKGPERRSGADRRTGKGRRRS